MKDRSKTKQQLIRELVELRREVDELKRCHTEHQGLMEKLKESEEKYRAIFETANDTIILTDNKGKILDVNEKVTKIGGYKREDLIGKNIRKLTKIATRKSMATITKNFIRRMAGIRVPPYEVEMMKANGEVVTVEINAVPMKKGGKIVGDLAILRNVTERKKVEDALRESEERFRKFFENEPEYCYMISPDGRILDINTSALETLGYEKKEIVGKPFLTTIYAPSCRKKAKDLFIKWKRMGKLRNEELNIITKTSEERTVLLSVDSLRSPNEQIRHSISVQRDITERKWAEEEKNRALHDLRERIKKLNCLYEISKIVEIPNISLEGILQKVVNVLPTCWQYPDITCVRITIQGQKFKTSNYKTTKWGQSTDIKVHGRKVGMVEVYYLVKKPEADEGPFLKEERNLIEIIAERLGRIIEREQLRKIRASTYRISEVAHSIQNFEELFRAIHKIINELMPAKNFYIALYDEVTETLNFPYFVDECDKSPAPRKLERGLTEYVLRTGEPLLATPEVLEELVKKGEVEVMGTPSIDWLGVPLKTEDKIIGVLVVQSYTKGVRFGEEDKDILTFVSTQIATAIEHKRAEERLDIEHKQLLSIFDSIDVPIYVSDPNTYEVLYANEALREKFGNVVGQKCYRVFQNLESPCPFCTNKHIFGKNEGQPYVWEFQNRISRRWFHCIDKTIHWPDGRMVR